MRTLGLFAISLTLVMLSACATTSNYEARIQSWEGKDAAALLASWGQPDDTEKLSNGNRMFVYARLKHEPLAYSGPGRQIASVGGRKPASEIYIKCATYFEVDGKNVIVSTLFRGNDCKWKD